MDRNHKRAPSVQALDPPPTHLDDTVKVPSFKHRTSDAQGPPPPTPGHVSSGPIFCLHTRPRYLKHDRKIRYITHSRLKTNASIVQALDPHPPTWTTPKVPSFIPHTLNDQGPIPHTLNDQGPPPLDMWVQVLSFCFRAWSITPLE